MTILQGHCLSQASISTNCRLGHTAPLVKIIKTESLNKNETGRNVTTYNFLSDGNDWPVYGNIFLFSKSMGTRSPPPKL
jgi:hypothetical protein